MRRNFVLDPEPVTSLDQYVASGGGDALRTARSLSPSSLIGAVEASGLRGRGGAGFPTGRKWRSVLASRGESAPLVAVNGAEGEPGSFKDRQLLRRNPYKILEGALIAAHAVGGDRVVVALKESFAVERELLERAVAELAEAGLAHGVRLTIATGPGEYLFGEETALLEVLAGRPPFPRIAPPYRHGADDPGDGTGTVAGVELAAGGLTDGSPTLVNNVETMANVAGIVRHGPDEFRSLGTAESPGTVLVTVSGRTRTHGVAEVEMGIPLKRVIEEVGGGPLGSEVVAVMPGVSGPILPGRLLDVPVSHEGFAQAGSALGCGALLVIDDAVDPVEVAHSAARFLAVESCAQCTPCKDDGLRIAAAMEALLRGDPTERRSAIEGANDALRTVADGARCSLARQHEAVVASLLSLFPDAFERHAEGAAWESPPFLVAPIVDLRDGKAILDEGQAGKQPDWSHDAEWSGAVPSEEIDTAAPHGVA